MASLHFYYATMNAGKSTLLLQANHNYITRGMNTALFSSSLDDRAGLGKIASRIGLEAEAHLFTPASDLFQSVANIQKDGAPRLDSILIDEAQFLTQKQVRQLVDVVNKMGIPVICYGLRTDFRGDLFPGSAALLAWADRMEEVRSVCHCGSKATMVARMGPDGKIVTHGEQVLIGDSDYVSFCMKHWIEETGL